MKTLCPREMSARLVCAAGRLLGGALLLVALCTAALAHAGSVYVPVDSWTYAAAERLAVLTATQQEILGMRPWTRSQFAHFLERAREMPHDDQAQELQNSLEREFAPELNAELERSAVEQVYTRSTQIVGTPLRDSFHFGQTIVNDFGRPYGQGFNNIDGAAGYGQYRAGMIYIRGEYQHGASLRPPDMNAISVLAGRDEVLPSQVITQGGASVNYFRLLDSYVGVSWGSHWIASLGKQSLWWGPDAGGAFLFTNNIEPIWMGRLTNDVPYKIPILGKARLDMFYGKLQGHPFMPEPWVHGEKISLEPFKNFQIGFARTVVFLGEGRPFSFKRLVTSYFSVGDQSNSDLPQNDPGDRRAGWDFSYKLPHVPMTLYTDAYSDDEPSPLAKPVRSAFRPGIYVARMPGRLSKMDLRVEGGYTVSLDPNTMADSFNYWNGIYKDGYTNKKLIIGDGMIGRAGVAWQATSSYWFSPRNKVQVTYRHRYTTAEFLPGGGTQNDIAGTADFMVKNNIELALGLQSERIILPLLFGGSTSPQYNTSGWIGVTYWPGHKAQVE